MLEISVAEVTDRLVADNPWWEKGGQVDSTYAKLSRRLYFPGFWRLLTEGTVRRAVILMGPRRVGKTVMLQQAVEALLTSGVPPETIMYVAIDTPTYTGLNLEKILHIFLNRSKLTRRSKVYVFFDEVQYLPNWEVHLKNLVDTYPSAKFVASGSAAAALKLKSQESGAGRFTDYMLPPLTFAEYLRFIKREEELITAGYNEAKRLYEYVANNIEELNKEFINYLNYGGYPEAVMSPVIQENPSRYIRNDIIDKVLLRDLPSLYGVDNIQELNRLFTTLAYNTANEVSTDALVQSSGVSINTIRRYLEYLEAAFLIVRVKRLDDKGHEFARERAFKVYLTNPSMRAALFKPLSANESAVGHLAETAIFSQWFHSEDMERIRYARWKKGEVDMVYVRRENMKPGWACEIKYSDRFIDQTNELKGLVEFTRKNPALIGHVMVTSKTRVGHTVSRGIVIPYRPCSLQCYLVGRNITDRKGQLSLLPLGQSAAE